MASPSTLTSVSSSPSALMFTSIQNQVDQRIQTALKRDDPGWRLCHACPTCTHKLTGEVELVFSMLVAMDRNDSLKCVLGWKPTPLDPGEGDAPVVGEPNEHDDERTVGAGYYLTLEQVDHWSQDIVLEWIKEHHNDTVSCLFHCLIFPFWWHLSSWLTVMNLLSVKTAGRTWQMKSMKRQRACMMKQGVSWHSVAMALCWWLSIWYKVVNYKSFLFTIGTSLNIKSSKYPLAAVKALLDAFGFKIGGGYDIGCKFSITLAHSPLGRRAKALQYQALVGSFHGHAHNRLCQLCFLATYVKGMGLEDLEGGEWCFSKSNALAAFVCHPSIFHCKQKIVEFAKHMDQNETYQNLSE